MELDVILVVVMLVSGVLAMIRGFTREFLSIASWLAAVLAVLILLKYFPETSKILATFIGHDKAAQAILSLVLFIVVLVVVHLITIYISDRVLSSSMGALDHTFGFIFGLGRGLVAVVILYLLFTKLVADHETWVKNSRSLKLVKSTGEMIVSLLPPDLAKMILDDPDDKDKNAYRIPSEKVIKTNKKKNVSVDVNRGYQSSDRRGLNQLVESTGSVKN